MSLHLHALKGCAPEPLANYLKALGILRLIVEQELDPEARGWWQDEQFYLLTKLTKQELEHFFLYHYAPTPLVSPWIKGSNLLKAYDKCLSQLESSTAKRFERFRMGIADAKRLLNKQREADAVIRAISARTKTNKTFQTQGQRELLKSSEIYRTCIERLQAKAARTDLTTSQRDEVRAATVVIEGMTTEVPRLTRAEAAALRKSDGYNQLSKAATSRFEELKDGLIPDCQRYWRGGIAEWLSAAVPLDAEARPKANSLLGTGGNDGHLDFANNFTQRLNELFEWRSPDGLPSATTADLLANALWATPTTTLRNISVGQFQPGNAGGANSSTGAMGGRQLNAWDFVLMLEGAILFSTRATRRFDPNSFASAAAPFAVRGHATGYGSSGDEECKGEQWLPLWGRPATLGEVRALFGEARLQLGRQVASRPVDAARAISRLGVARGISSFVRYGYLKRNGKSIFAVPLDRISVREAARSRLIDDLGPWMDRLQRIARGKNAPGRLVHAERQLADAVIAALTHDETPGRWQTILLAAAAVEGLQATGCGFGAGPIPLLRPEWIAAAGDEIEVRLAAALGSAAAEYTKTRRRRDPVRHHWLPLEPGARRFRVSEERLAKDPRVVMKGRDAIADCAAVAERRMIESAMKGTRQLPLMAAPGFGAQLSDISALLAGKIDLDRVLNLARAFMAVNWDSSPSASNERPPRGAVLPPEGWLALRLTCLPWPLSPDRKIATEAGLVRRLLAGDSAGAIGAALAHLRSAGIRPPLQGGVTDKNSGRLWAAALVFPIDRGAAWHAATVLDPTLRGMRYA
jgi:CRISPR-associated protein Csx17